MLEGNHKVLWGKDVYAQERREDAQKREVGSQ